MSEPIEDFELLEQIRLKSAEIVVTKWRNTLSGLTVVHLDYEGMF